MKKKIALLVAGFALSSTCVIAQVSLPFYEPFPIEYVVGTSLGAGTSASVWTYGNSPGSGSPYFTNIDLSYPMLVDSTTPDLSVQFRTNAGTSDRDRGVALNFTNGVNFTGPLYFSYLLRVDQGAVGRTNVLSFTRNSVGTGGGITPSVGVYLQPDGRFMISKSSLDNPLASTETVVLGKTYLIVGRYTVVAGTGNDPFELWINPPPATLGVPESSVPAPTLSTTVGPDSTYLYGFYFTAKRGTYPWMGGAEFLVDDVRLGTTWADVTPIPEPATVLLSLLGGFGLLWLRLRRRA